MNTSDRAVMLGLIALVAVIGGLAWMLLGQDPEVEDPPEQTMPPMRADAPETDEPRAPKTRPGETGAAREVIEQPVVEIEPTRRPAMDGPAGSLAGYVFTPHQMPVSGAEIEILKGGAVFIDIPGAHDETGIFSSTDGAGRFDIESLAVGTDYVVKATHPDWAAANVGPIEVKAGETTDVPKLVLRSALRVFGMVTDKSGLPLGSVHVSVSDRTVRFGERPNFDKEPWKTILTNANGSYEFPHLAFKNFAVTAESDGYAAQTKVNTVILDPTKVREMNFELGQAYTISGWVKSEDGVFLEDAKVRAHLLKHLLLLRRGCRHRCLGILQPGESRRGVLRPQRGTRWLLHIDWR